MNYGIWQNNSTRAIVQDRNSWAAQVIYQALYSAPFSMKNRFMPNRGALMTQIHVDGSGRLVWVKNDAPAELQIVNEADKFYFSANETDEQFMERVAKHIAYHLGLPEREDPVQVINNEIHHGYFERSSPQLVAQEVYEALKSKGMLRD